MSEDFNNIRDALEEKTILLKGADAATTGGFTQVPNFVLERDDISSTAKLAYTMLLKYAWSNKQCFPGQERLALDMGVGLRSITRAIKELKETGLINIIQRGLGKPNIYELNFTVDKAAKTKRK